MKTIFVFVIYTQWAHFPHIRFGLKLDGTKNKQAKLDQPSGGDTQATQKANGFY